MLNIMLASDFAKQADQMPYNFREALITLTNENKVDILFTAGRGVDIRYFGYRAKKVPQKVETFAQAVKWCIERAQKEKF